MTLVTLDTFMWSKIEINQFSMREIKNEKTLYINSDMLVYY